MGLLAIDPGRDMGWAWFHDGTLLTAAVGDGDTPTYLPAPLGPHDEVIAERPCERRNGRRKATVDDLITLSIRLGRALDRVGYACRVRLVKPHQWKGELPKEICHERIKELLRPEELAAFDRSVEVFGATAHNALDAIGLGLFHLRRFR